ncbi:hypothetical protein B0H66DRAFT_597200 [Apodospora peruviana]|uniref:F-box domain-containing protein n=1 Tax=Apodospora peruviana TaxID=516989 RepID=A0AAE0MEI4_9PEZI|nr:hypothetical protein B0H66DRAFT_597200 [Apodospora peruviana]
MATVAAGEGRRSSIEKTPMVMDDYDTAEPAAFERLPDEIIQQILQATDSNGFASLALLNSKWRSVAQQAHLYGYHLSNCPSYAMSHASPPSASADDLPKLRRLFAREVKRNLFEAYLRPRKTVIKVISNSISSSSCPGGEGIQFSPSPKGHHLLGYNSSRIYVIDVRGADIAVKREFKILRRPAATCINDAGTTLAVLLTEMQVDIYDLTPSPPRRTQSIILDHSPRAIALSPCGSVLAAAYEGGIEVSALNPGALSTERRAVKCDAVDALSFSFDGTQILGTTVHTSQPNTVILTAPYYDPGSLMADDNISALWTTSILFPNTSRDCSHAVLIQHGKHEEAAWTFTYDRSFETFRAVRIDDLRNGTTYFTGPVPSPASQAKLIPCTLPAASYYGELVSAGFQGKEVWLYGVPEDLDAVPELSNPSSDNSSNTSSILRRNSGPSIRSASRMQENSDPARVPQWQVLCDKLRNTFIAGCRIGELEGVNTVKWVADFQSSSVKERLVIAARGISPVASITEDEGIDFVDGGRLTLVDFDYSLANGVTTEVTIDVGTKEPEVLEEEHRDMATEVAIVRRRTVAQKRGTRGAVTRAATTASRAPPVPALPTPPVPSSSRQDAEEDDPLLPRRIGTLPVRRIDPPAITEETDVQETIEEQEALDAPYSHASPRSGTTLRRAATAAAVNRRLQPQPTAGNVEYRRADGRTEHPHESDADNWVPPPPPYAKEDPGDMPDFLRHAIPPVAVGAPSANGQRQQPTSEQQQRQQSVYSPPPASQPLPRSNTVLPVRQNAPLPAFPPVPPMPNLPLSVSTAPVHQREESGSTLRTGPANSRPTSRDSRYHDGENIYDVSPPESPAASAVRPHGVTSREPSGTRTASSPAPSPYSNQLVSPESANSPNQQQLPVLPRIETATAISQQGGPPALDLHIPSPTLSNMMPTWDGTQAANSPSVRMLSNTRTWPMQPKPQVMPAVAAGYPHSAPPTNFDANDALGRSYPPAPRPDQLASLNNRADPPRRLSGAFQVQCVPVGSRVSGDFGPNRTSYQRPLSQQQQYPQYQQPQGQPEYRPLSQQNQDPQYQQMQPQPMFQSQQQVPVVQQYAYAQAHQSQPQPQPPQEDLPLIISTPKGVTGAFDAPDRRISGRRAEAPILAPVPRHPRPTVQSAILRPPTERMDTIYSVASVNGGQAVAGPSTLGVPAPESSSTTRVSSLNRRQSRAERSAAKNIADAKRRGWAGRTKSTKRKSKKKDTDYDAASSAAWTDVTTTSQRSNFFGSLRPDSAAGQHGRGDRKCVVM